MVKFCAKYFDVYVQILKVEVEIAKTKSLATDATNSSYPIRKKTLLLPAIGLAEWRPP